MDAIKYTINEILFTIPKEVLDIAFSEQYSEINDTLSLEQRIENTVIRKRVIHNINAVSGENIQVDLDKCLIKQYNDHTFIIEVSSKLTENRSITSVSDIIVNDRYTGAVNNMYGNNSNGSLFSATSAMVGNMSGAGPITTSRLELIGNNVIICEEPSILITTGTLSCNVTNDPNLNNLKPGIYEKFAELTIQACKSYIRNRLRVKIDKGYISGGSEINSIKEIIDEYADSEELYKEILNDGKWKRAKFTNNRLQYNNYVKGYLGGIS